MCGSHLTGFRHRRNKEIPLDGIVTQQDPDGYNYKRDCRNKEIPLDGIVAELVQLRSSPCELPSGIEDSDSRLDGIETTQ